MASHLERPGMTRKLPALTPDNRAFWQGGADGELRMHHCAACTQFFHPPAPLCPRCLSEDVAPKAVCGAGKVVEVDETFIGKKADQPERKGYARKHAALSLVERGGTV